MPKGGPKAKASVVAWWLSGGEEECPHCGRLYIYEMEFRCPDCDSACCPHCKRKHAEDRDVCPECVESREAAEGLSHG
jgi:hypothetical protein